MGKHVDKFLKDRPHQLRLYIYANLAAAGACIVDRFIFGHPYALEVLSLLIILINGFALWQQNNEHNSAYNRDEEIEKAEAEAEVVRDMRIKARDFK